MVGKYMKSKYQRRKRAKLTKEWKIERKCEECGNKFIPFNKKQIYCNKLCSYNALLKKLHKKYKRKIPQIEKICIICNNKFKTNRKRQLVCGTECRRKYIKQQSKKYITPIGPWALRFKILTRDNFTCQYCGKNPKEDNIKLMVDHIIPRSKGGSDKEDNLKTSCNYCNLGKADSLI